MQPDVSLVIVNHRTAAHLREALAAARAAAGALSLETIVVDSASPDREEARAVAADVWLPLRRNRGFAAAANAGARVARGRALAFFNPDARPAPGGIERLHARLSRTVAAAGPRLVDTRGRHQTGDAGSHPTWRRALAYALGHTRALFADGRGGAVGWLSGACLLVDARAFRHVGGFDESFFLFAEDVALGAALGREGLTSFHDASVVVEHAGGVSYRRKRGGLSPLEGLWARNLVRAHGLSERRLWARAVFAGALSVGLAGRAVVLSGRGAEGRTRGRRLLRAAWRSLT